MRLRSISGFFSSPSVPCLPGTPIEQISGPLSLSVDSPHTESVWNALTTAITTPMWSVTLLASDLRMQRLNEAATEWYVKLEIPLARLGGDFPSVRAVHVTIAYNVRLLAWAEFEQWEAFHASLLSNLPATSTLLLEPSETDGVFFCLLPLPAVHDLPPFAGDLGVGGPWAARSRCQGPQPGLPHGMATGGVGLLSFARMLEVSRPAMHVLLPQGLVEAPNVCILQHVCCSCAQNIPCECSENTHLQECRELSLPGWARHTRRGWAGRELHPEGLECRGEGGESEGARRRGGAGWGGQEVS